MPDHSFFIGFVLYYFYIHPGGGGPSFSRGVVLCYLRLFRFGWFSSLGEVENCPLASVEF